MDMVTSAGKPLTPQLLTCCNDAVRTDGAASNASAPAEKAADRSLVTSRPVLALRVRPRRRAHHAVVAIEVPPAAGVVVIPVAEPRDDRGRLDTAGDASDG